MKQLAVLNILNTERGRAIAQRMMEWLEPNYQVFPFYHDGSRYEYDGLKFMQDLVLKRKRPCLYLHTRGAVNQHWSTELTHALWKEQFGENGQAYFDAVKGSTPIVSCPFSDETKTTWYNGFVINYQAAKVLDILLTSDRLYYERMFCNNSIEVFPLLSASGVAAARSYLHKFEHQNDNNNPNGVDIVYIVGNGSKWNNNELRFSLRSIAKYGQNIRRVIIVGDCPEFVNREKVVYLPFKDISTCKHRNILHKIQKCVETLKMTEPFLISSDDHFYTQPTDFLTYPHYCKGDLTEDNGDGEYGRSLTQTKHWLDQQGWHAYKTNPHCNTWIEPKALAALLPTFATADAPDGIEINCALGSFLAAKGTKLTDYADGKVMQPIGYNEWHDRAQTNHCLSIADRAVDMNLCRFLMDKYPSPCQYERTGIKINDLYNIRVAVQLKTRKH